MVESKLKVVLLNYTPNPVNTVAKSARLSHYGKSISELNEIITEEYAIELVRRLIDMGHDSALENAVFTFGVEGISRACSHQLVRHRMASYVQQSQRYVAEKDFDFIMPPTIAEKEDAKQIFLDEIESINKAYKKLCDIGIKKEDARFLLPNACETKIICTFNMRSLINFFKLRISNHAQWEIRELAIEMYKLVKNIAPVFLEKLDEEINIDKIK